MLDEVTLSLSQCNSMSKRNKDLDNGSLPEPPKHKQPRLVANQIVPPNLYYYTYAPPQSFQTQRPVFMEAHPVHRPSRYLPPPQYGPPIQLIHPPTGYYARQSFNQLSQTTHRIVNPKEQYVVDTMCHPAEETHRNTKEEAHDLLCSVRGGFANGNKAVRANGTYAMSDGVHSKQYQYRCGCYSQCTWKAQIRMKLDGRWFVYQHKYNNRHCHSITAEPEQPFDDHGLHRSVLELCDAYVSSDGRCVLRVTPMDLTMHVTKVFTDNPKYKQLQYLVKKTSFFEHTQRQLINYVCTRRVAYIKKCLGGITSIANNDTLSRILADWELHLPSNYVPCSTYDSPEAIAKAIGVAETHHMFVYNISSGKLYDTFKRKGVPPQPAHQRNFETKMEFAFFIFSPTSLFQLLSLATRRKGTRLAMLDGTGGICNDMSSCIVFGSTSVKLRIKHDRVTSSLRVLAYLHAGGERMYPVLVTLYALRELSWKCFAIDLQLDWGESDHATAFINSYRAFKGYPALCGEAYRDTVSTKDDSSLSVADHAAMPMGMLATYDSDGEQATTAATEKPPAIVTQLTQEQEDVASVVSKKNAPDFKRCGLICSQATLSDRTCDCCLEETCLQCAFHAFQPFAKKNSYVDKFKNKALCKNIRGKNKVLIKASPAYRDMCLIKDAKTDAQRATIWSIVLQHWREVYGETQAADHLEDTYGRYPNYNWNTSVTGEPGIYPIGNPVESHNLKMKSANTNLTKNASLATLLVWNGPRLLEHDTLLRRDPCTIEYPKRCSKLMVSVEALLEEGVDIVEVKNGWLCNLNWMIGVPLTKERINEVFQSYQGNTTFFVEKEDKGLMIRAGRRMIRATNSVCLVTRNADSQLVGNCDSCMKELGYNCAGATFLRNKNSMFASPLHLQRMTIANVRGKVYNAINSGNVSDKYWSGLSSKGKQSRPALRSFEDWIRSLSNQQLHKVVDYLCLIGRRPDEKRSRAKDFARTTLISMLLEFQKDRKGYRDEARNQYSFWRAELEAANGEEIDKGESTVLIELE